MSERISLLQHLTLAARAGHLDPALVTVVQQIGAASRQISAALARSALAGVLGATETSNASGEAQKKLDVLANDAFIQALSWTGAVAGIASEELDGPYQVPGATGDYLVLLDPLDGSSNIDVNISVGSIFSILHAPGGAAGLTDVDFLQPGKAQVCAGFTVYGPATVMVLCFGHGVQGFTLDPVSGEFLLTQPDIRIPERTSEYAINASNQRWWQPPVQRYIAECMAGKDGPRGRDFNMRWVGSMVGDVYRLLTRGGIFMYPRDTKDASKPGKLRLMYEANPIGYVVEHAGGAASTGYERILDIPPEKVHQRVAVILGSKEEVDTVVAYHRAG
ncbi:class 1 fructose-bisphosphatase [Immundisolibacter sp.]|uniref:class 1 fructose-bisphosphatase n=1 Tax=Immundisolibacter sp. TaxID=1934948 RepID=UPI00198C4AC4|nr:class 1 fructose-bisphosphatase [Immundisolibacter sp.]MBC7161144.1 class 1 fructose-bisphosphatase [Immundisolibacter sp.]MEA3219326.1 Fructose-1,6-bisphosphatase class 1 [Immundisolibacter sp.]